MATNYVSANYQEILDVQTNNNGVTVIGFHTPTGGTPLKMLYGFYRQFRKFRYNGCTVRVQPVASLPADPLGVSYEAGSVEGTRLLDPRELVNPLLFHGCHGESLNWALNVAYKNTSIGSVSINELQASAEGPDGDLPGLAEIFNPIVSAGDDAYYSALSDRSFRKYHPQVGGRLPHMRPLVHKLAVNHPILPHVNQPSSGALIAGDSVGQYHSSDFIRDVQPLVDNQFIDMSMFTSGVTGLGWLPTYQFWTGPNKTGEGVLVEPTSWSFLPKLFMGVLILPPSYAVEQYFRVYINHSFSFKDFSTALGPLGYPSESSSGEYDEILAGALYAPTYRQVYHNLLGADAAATVSALENDELSVEVLGGSAELRTAGVS